MHKAEKDGSASRQTLEQRAAETMQLAENAANPEAKRTLQFLSFGYAALARWRARRGEEGPEKS